MQFNFFKDYFRTKAKFIHKPNLVEEYTEDDVVFYSMDSDLVFFNGKKNIVIKAVDEGGGVFYTNLASIPNYLSWFVKADRKKMKYASVLHDGLYDDKNLYKRVYADWMFLLALKVEGEYLPLRWIAFLSVRIFGSSYRS